MPTYRRQVRIPGKTSQELFDKISQDIDRLLEKFSVGKFEILRDSSRKQVVLKSAMINATLICGEEVLTLDGSLSFMAAPFRGKIDEGINRWLAKTFEVNVQS